jgi:hypothetical protein
MGIRIVLYIGYVYLYDMLIITRAIGVTALLLNTTDPCM